VFLYYCSGCFVFTFLNTTFFIVWLSKKEVTIETTVFGVDLLAMKIGVEALRGLCYKFCMMGGCLVGKAKDPGGDLCNEDFCNEEWFQVD